MDKFQHIVIITSFNDHYNFFSRLAKALIKRNYKITFVTNRFSIVYNARNEGYFVVPIVNCKEEISNSELPSSLEEISGMLNQRQLKNVYSSTYKALNNINNDTPIDYIFVWGGIRIMDSSAKKWASDKNVKTLFFELANLPNKLFADPYGTNAQSALAYDCSFLRNYSVDEEAYKKWQNEYVKKSLKGHSVPQSKGVLSIDIKKNILDLYGATFKNYCKFEPILDFVKLKNKLKGNFSKFKFDNIKLNELKYAFYPMQVSVDAQILVNSKTNNIKALKVASMEAAKRGLKLLVKPHPAERDREHIKEVYKLKEEIGFLFIDGNTIEIINNSELVITINSTVGLQGMILGKEVICLGNSFYSNFSEKELAAYIQNYLLDIDFWATDEISNGMVDKILERAN